MILKIFLFLRVILLKHGVLASTFYSWPIPITPKYEAYIQVSVSAQNGKAAAESRSCPIFLRGVVSVWAYC